MTTSIESIKNKVMWSKLQGNTDSHYLEDKIEELKKDPAYANWSEKDLYDYASSLLMAKNAKTNMLNMQAISSRFAKPADPKWSQYSYEEILQMEDAGVLIPEEFLEWAHSMESSNVTEYELDTGDSANINDADSLKSDIGDAGNSGKKDVAKVFNKQVLAHEKILENAEKTFEQYSAQLESVTEEANSVQEATLKKVQEMMSEFNTLDKKVQSGEQLTEDEKSRYGQLGVLMTKEVQSSAVQIDNFTADFDAFSKLMNESTRNAKIAQDYAKDTSFVGDLITEYEASHKSRLVVGNNHIFDGATGTVGLLKANTVGKNLAVTSVKAGLELQNTTFTSDKSIKKVASQIKDITSNIDVSNEAMIDVVENNANTDSVVIQPEEQNKKEPAPMEDNPEVTDVVTQNNNEDAENQNVFAQEEDLNNINSIIKRQQKQPPKIQPQDMIVEL